MKGYSLPISVEIQQASFSIRNQGDYRMVLDCFSALNDPELTEQERLYACLLIFYELDSLEDLNRIPNIKEAVEKMFEFFNCGNENPGRQMNYKLIDWEKDSQMIISSVNRVAQKEVRAEKYIHWWTFMGYYMEIGECTLSYIVSIRHKIATNQKLEKYERKFKSENPEYFQIDMRSIGQKQDEDLILNLWNGGGDC